MEDNFEANATELNWERTHSLFGQPKDWLDQDMMEALPQLCNKDIQFPSFLNEDSTEYALNPLTNNEQYQPTPNRYEEFEISLQESEFSHFSPVEAMNEDESLEKAFNFEINNKVSSTDSLDESNSIYSEVLSKHKRKNHRWGYRKDIQLFQHLRALEKEGRLVLSEILSCENGRQLKNKAFKQLCKTLNWKNTPFKLQKRIKSMMCTPFSAREQKRIKNLVRKSSYTNIEHEMVLDKFPGKSLEVIQRACDIICKSRWDRNLNTLDINQQLINY